jgi:hypothetical protein
MLSRAKAPLDIGVGMSTYTVTIVNEHFSQTGEQEAADNIEVWKAAISSAIAIAADQVSHGSPFFGAEVTIAQGNEQIGRYLVSVGAAPLKD